MKTVVGIGRYANWSMTWTNNNASPVLTRVIDDLDPDLILETGPTCIPSGSTTVDTCAYDSANHRVVYEGAIDQQIVIRFTTRSVNLEPVVNQAIAYVDSTGDGTIDSTNEPSDYPTDPAPEDPTPFNPSESTPVPALSGWGAIILGLLLATGLLVVYRRRDA